MNWRPGTLVASMLRACRGRSPRHAIRLLATHLIVGAALGSVGPTGARADGNATAQQASDILSRRCMVCHGCYDAPCQLKMEAHEGLERGASKALVYDGGRLAAAPTTRLFDDAQTVRQWRKMGFFPALQPQGKEQSTLYRTLLLKQAHPLASEGPLPSGFDFSLNRDQQCPTPEEFTEFQSKYPLWGMPYGLPGLARDEHEAMIAWLEDGAPAPLLKPLDTTEQEARDAWERFLNGDDKRQHLMSRYLYEHLFLANLHFAETPDAAWFRLVRSRTPPGKPLDIIATRRPYDDPGTRRVYYRMQRMPVTPLRKTHMPYLLDAKRMARYRELFLEPEYTVAEVPGYRSIEEANPFHVFREIPPRSRYEFLLDEAQFTIMNFIKGPVCRGRIALSVIEEHFWVAFESPDLIDLENDQQALARESENLRLPQPKTNTVIDLLSWRKYARAQASYLKAKSEYTAAQLERDRLAIDYSTIWDGDGRNPNAALTIFRHFDTASVVKGFVGTVPKTAWVIDYPLLERIHYLLVAGFDVFGSSAHQLESRLYMDFLRMEGEINFLVYMPEEERRALANYWYRDAPTSVIDHLRKADVAQITQTAIDFETDDPKAEFLTTLRRNIFGAAANDRDYRASSPPATATLLQKMEATAGAHNRFLPNVSFLNVISENSDQVFTLIRNSGYSNIAQIFSEDKRRLPDEDNLTVANGFIGAYPNQFFQVNADRLDDFVTRVTSLDSAAAYNRLLADYGVARNASWFWRISDKLHNAQRADEGLASGLFDYSRYKGY